MPRHPRSDQRVAGTSRASPSLVCSGACGRDRQITHPVVAVAEHVAQPVLRGSVGLARVRFGDDNDSLIHPDLIPAVLALKPLHASSLPRPDCRPPVHGRSIVRGELALRQGRSRRPLGPQVADEVWGADTPQRPSAGPALMFCGQSGSPPRARRRTDVCRRARRGSCRGQMPDPIKTHQRLAARLAAREAAQLLIDRPQLPVQLVDHLKPDRDLLARGRRLQASCDPLQSASPHGGAGARHGGRAPRESAAGIGRAGR